MLAQRMQVNPVVTKELRSRMRGVRAYIALTVFLVLLSLLSLAVYQVALLNVEASGDISARAIIGSALFYTIGGLEMLLVCFMSPAFTMGTISGERERQTYDLLLTTLLRPTSIVFGKLLAALSYIFLLIFASMPVLSIAFLFGGVTLEQFGLVYILLVVNAFTYGTLGLFFSSMMRSTLGAAILSYGTLLLLTIGSAVISMLLTTALNATGGGYRFVFEPMYINPFYTLVTLQSDPSISTAAGGNGIPSWILHVLLSTTLGVLAFLGAARMVRPTRVMSQKRNAKALK